MHGHFSWSMFEFEKSPPVEAQDSRKLTEHSRNLLKCTSHSQSKTKDHNMKPVGVGEQWDHDRSCPKITPNMEKKTAHQKRLQMKGKEKKNGSINRSLLFLRVRKVATYHVACTSNRSIRCEGRSHVAFLKCSLSHTHTHPLVFCEDGSEDVKAKATCMLNCWFCLKFGIDALLWEHRLSMKSTWSRE